MPECNGRIAIQLIAFYTIVQAAGFVLLFFFAFPSTSYTPFFRTLCSSIYSVPVAITTTVVLYFYLINNQPPNLPDPGIF